MNDDDNMSGSYSGGPPMARAATGVFGVPSELDASRRVARALSPGSDGVSPHRSHCAYSFRRMMSQGSILSASFTHRSGDARRVEDELKTYIHDNGTVQTTTSSLPMNIRKGPKIGHGGFATVFSGINTDNGELVAIKEIKVGQVSGSSFRDVEKEFELLRAIRHPHIIKYLLFEHSATTATCRIVMEFMAGGSLLQTLQRFGTLNENILRCYAEQMLKALEHIHNAGITHRDIKPANILSHSDGRLKLADFGCSKKITELGTITNHVIGTPAYMAPECIRGQTHQKSDVWSLGCTLLELATGERPWHDCGIADHIPLMFHISTCRSMPTISTQLPMKMFHFFMRCFTWDVERRPSASELLSDPWLTDADDDTVITAQKEIEEIGIQQCVNVVHSLTCSTQFAHTTTASAVPNVAHIQSPSPSSMSPPNDEMPQILLLGVAGSSQEGDGTGTSPPGQPHQGVATAAAMRVFASVAEAAYVDESDDSTEVSPDGSAGTSMMPASPMHQQRPSISGPLQIAFPVSANGVVVNVSLNIEPSDVTIKMVDKKPSFVLGMSRNVRDQLQSAMVELQRQSDVRQLQQTDGDPLSSSMGPGGPPFSGGSAAAPAPPHHPGLPNNPSYGAFGPMITFGPGTTAPESNSRSMSPQTGVSRENSSISLSKVRRRVTVREPTVADMANVSDDLARSTSSRLEVPPPSHS